jgi:hypothetical protein
MLAGLANRRQAGNPKIFAAFVKCNSCLVLFSCWLGLPTFGSPETHPNCRFSSDAILVSIYVHAGRACQPLAARELPKTLQFPSNAVLVSFNVHADRACQPSEARKPENFCSFRQSAILVSFNVHAGRACQFLAPREHKYIAVFR